MSNRCKDYIDYCLVHEMRFLFPLYCIQPYGRHVKLHDLHYFLPSITNRAFYVRFITVLLQQLFSSPYGKYALFGCFNCFLAGRACFFFCPHSFIISNKNNKGC
jgi:hypothetical protein